MSHDPDAHGAPHQVFADGCDECEYRAGRGLGALAFLDNIYSATIGRMAAGEVEVLSRLDDRVVTEVRIAARAVSQVGLRLEEVQ